MEQNREDRKEPKVEVNHEPEEYNSSPGAKPIGRSRAVNIKWIIIPILILGIFGLGLGLWVVLKYGDLPGKRQTEDPEIAALRSEVLKLKGEIEPLKKEILSLKEEQKGFQDQTKVLQGQVVAFKDQLTVLAKRKEPQGDKKPTSKVTAYKIKRGDTLASIAKRYRVSPEDLRNWNHLPLKGRLNPGQTITIHSPTP